MITGGGTVQDDSERIAAIRGVRWMAYSRALQILAQLEDLLTMPKTHRMGNVLIVGETNNGKTMIVRKFAREHPPRLNLEGDASCFPVLLVEAPHVPEEGRFYNAILHALRAPFKAASRLDQREFQVMRLLETVGVRVLIIDEIHHILSGNRQRQRQFLAMIKQMGNELMIPIVGVGIQKAFAAINTDPQLASRFEPAILPKWRMGDEYLRLLATFEKTLPLQKASNLTAERIALKVLSMTEGTIGEISTLLRRAALHAIESRKEQITISVLDRVGYTSPSGRNRERTL